MGNRSIVCARDLLFEDACELMNCGDYDTAAILLRFSAFLGRRDALRNLYDMSLDDERWLSRVFRCSFYRILSAVSAMRQNN